MIITQIQRLFFLLLETNCNEALQRRWLDSLINIYVKIKEEKYVKNEYGFTDVAAGESEDCVALVLQVWRIWSPWKNNIRKPIS